MNIVFIFSFLSCSLNASVLPLRPTDCRGVSKEFATQTRQAGILRRLQDHSYSPQDIDSLVTLALHSHTMIIHVEDPERFSRPRPIKAALLRYGERATENWPIPSRGGIGSAIHIKGPPEICELNDFEHYGVRPHKHEEAHVTLVTGGSAKFLRFAGDEIQVTEVKPGDIVIIPAEQGHTFFTGPDGLEVVSYSPASKLPNTKEFSTPISVPNKPRFVFTGQSIQ